jgi:hypothetical protein
MRLARVGRCRAQLQVVASSVFVFLASGASVTAQTGDLSKFFSALGGVADAPAGGNAAPAIGQRVLDSVYADDPSAEDAIREWYAKQDIRLPPPSTSNAGAARPAAPSTELLDMLRRGLQAKAGPHRVPAPLPPEYVDAVERYLKVMQKALPTADAGLARLREALLGLAGGPAADLVGGADNPEWSVRGCTVAEVMNATRPFTEYLIAKTAEGLRQKVKFLTDRSKKTPNPSTAGSVSNIEKAGQQHISGLRDNLRVWGPGNPPFLAARKSDEIVGGNYHQARWHYQAGRGIVERMANTVVMPSLPWDEWSSQILSAVSSGTDDLSVLAPFYAPVAVERHEKLLAIKAWIDALRARGCSGHADLVRAIASAKLAVGEEYASLGKMQPSSYWKEFGLPTPTLKNRPTADERIGRDRGPQVEAALLPERVDSILGPMPRPPSQSAPTSSANDPRGSTPSRQPGGQTPPGSASSPGFGPQAGGGSQPAGSLPTSPGRGATNRPGGLQPPGGSPAVGPNRGQGGKPSTVPQNQGSDRLHSLDRPPAQPIVAGGDRPGTWISIGGVGSWPQRDLAGFWRYSGYAGTEELNAILIRTSPDLRHFDGYSVRDGKVSGRTIDMNRDGRSNGWKGKILLALIHPKGACPHWSDGGFLIQPGSVKFSGVAFWPRTSVEQKCERKGDIDVVRPQVERIVLTAFHPIVADKYIHLIGVPAGGSTSAQYQAGVEFRCDTRGLPPLTPKVIASAGRVISLGEPCRYQLVVSTPGSYDIKIEFHDEKGTVLHADHLRADVPPIPGLTG